ncbi:E3 ubiquitin-protein ligase BIG BROTHER [Linum perenne]
MSWNSGMDVHYMDTSYPYNSAGSFMEYFQGLTYEHVNFIFDGGCHVQDSGYGSQSYKFGALQPGSTPHYDPSDTYEALDHGPRMDEYERPFGGSSRMPVERTAVTSTEWDSNDDATSHINLVDCVRRHHSSHDFHQGTWQDSLDPDDMTYEELLELGEAVGSQSRGLPQEHISLLPVSRYKCCIFSRRKSRTERCVICQMGYKRGDKRITLPCKHIYHAGCGSKWLSINKACPICYTEVSIGSTSIKK